MPTIICAGMITLDVVYGLEAFPVEGSKVRAAETRMVPGGGAMFAAMAIARLGGIARLAGAVGDDAFGRLLRDEMAMRGIDDSLVQTLPDVASSHSAVLVTEGGERTVVNFREPRLANLQLAGDVRAFDVVLADTRCPKLAEGLFAAAQAQGKPAVLDGEAPLPEQLLQMATHLAFSEQGLADLDGQTPTEIARANKCWACVTRGRVPVQTSDGSHIAVPNVTPLDTLGAGDVWHGAFAFALAIGRKETDAVRFANTTAALFVSQVGEDRFPTRDEVEKALL